MRLRDKIPVRTLSLLLAIIFFVIVIFVLFGEPVEAWANGLMQHSQNHIWKTGLLVVALLVIDVVVPIPSSIVCTAAGIFMGITAGTLAAWVGLTGTVLASYLIGRYATKPAEGIIGKQEFLLLRQFHQRHGLWLLIAMRPVPIFSEASVLFAGIARLGLWSVLLVTGPANLIVAGMYVALGTWGRETQTFLPAFGLSIMLSAIFMGIAHWRSKSMHTTGKGTCHVGNT